MNKNRLEAFSDGVLAIIITIMILEIKVPKGDTFDDLKSLFSIFISYILNFIYNRNLLEQSSSPVAKCN